MSKIYDIRNAIASKNALLNFILFHPIKTMALSALAFSTVKLYEFKILECNMFLRSKD